VGFSLTGVLTRILILCSFFCGRADIILDRLSFGSSVEQIATKDIHQVDIHFPQKEFLTVLFFFNIEKASNIRILSEISFMLINLPYDRIELIGISKGKSRLFFGLKESRNNFYRLLNDSDSNISERFDYVCGICIKILFIDRECRLRYITSHYDPQFLRQVIERYGNEK
jgi:hypothetical protein